MKWHKFALNPQVLDELYDDVPNLNSVELFAFNLHRDDPTLKMAVDLPRFPHRPSKRWHKDFNTAQLLVSFIGVREIALSGWHTRMLVTFEIKQSDNDLKVGVNGENIDFHVSFLCTSIRFESVSPYLNK